MPPTLADLGSLVVGFIDIVYALGLTIFLGLAILLGLQYMTSRGEADKLEEVRRRLGYLVIGFVIYFMSFAIVSFFYSVLDVKDCNGNTVRPGFNIIFEEVCE